jgi:hypothetical protein
MAAAKLSIHHLDLAFEIHSRLESWRVADSMLDWLHEKRPEFDLGSTRLKVVAVNSFYSTRLMADELMAKHIVREMDKPTQDPVTRIACEHGIGKRRFLSFASKFAHFFIDRKFPIYDRVARETVSLLLNCSPAAMEGDYAEYCAHVKKVNTAVEAGKDSRRLDRYLWLVGQYRDYCKNPAKINGEARRLFESAGTSSEIRAQLDELIEPVKDHPKFIKRK